MSRSSLKHDLTLLLFLILLSGGLFLLPGPATVSQPTQGFKARAKVVSTDDSDVARHELVLFGSQRLILQILEGPYKGQEFPAGNQLRAQLELDKLFQPGDIVVAVSPRDTLQPGDELVAQDYARGRWTTALFFVFCILLILFGRLTGFNALLSFVFSCLVVWKLLIPLVLAGWHASTVVFVTVAVLTGVIMYLVAGWTRKGISAFAGAMLGVVASLALAHFLGRVMNVNGATMPFAQQLLYSGFSGLDLQDIFFGAIVLASSGAVMDLAMDISAGVSEVARHSPGLGRRALFMSGIRIGRAVVGTMTTTLLLAYSGGYLTLLMVFAAQGTSPVDFINSTLVSAEFVKTMVGSFGLVLVAPASALVAACLHDNG